MLRSVKQILKRFDFCKLEGAAYGPLGLKLEALGMVQTDVHAVKQMAAFIEFNLASEAACL